MTCVPIILEPWAARRAKAGKFRMVNLLSQALMDLGHTSEIVADDPLLELRMDPDDKTPSLWWRKRPLTAGGLVFREAWRPPFWRIEARYDRWDWEIASLPFNPENMDGGEAADFCARLRKWHGIPVAKGDVVIIALQEVLTRQRDFQSCAPLQMVEQVVAEAIGPVRIVRHPRGKLTDAEVAALQKMATRPGVRTVDGPTEPLLSDAGRFATMNSTTTIAALLAGVPVTHFANSEFHHLSGKIITRDIAERYVYWLLTTACIRAGQDDAVAQITSRLQRLAVSRG